MDTLQFLYHTIPGRCVLKVLTRPGISKACGRFLDSDLSHFLIKSFADKNEIDLSEYELDGVRSFNDFFSRRIKAGFRPVDMDEKHLIAPCVIHLAGKRCGFSFRNPRNNNGDSG